MLWNTKRGFTLIELLVVIAIIAILAAILFPVFAQAREKARQSSCGSNYKQTALGIIQYVQDFDETFPQANAFNPSAGTWYGPYNIWTTPSNSRAYSTLVYRDAMWANATQPYIKNYQIYNCPSAPLVSGFGPPLSGTAIPMSEVFNGDLSSYTIAGIAAPASLMMLWNGLLDNNYPGYTYSNPVLTCSTPNPCVYKPKLRGGGCDSDTKSTNGGNGGVDTLVVFGGASFSEWNHSSGANRAYADGHMKFAVLKGDYHSDPFVGTSPVDGTVVTNNGYNYYTDSCHAYLFAPDYQP